MAEGEVDSSTIASRYSEDYSAAVGQGFSSDDIDDLATYIEDARVADDKHSDEVLVYEILSKTDWEQKISTLVDKWSAVRIHIRECRLC